MLFKRRNTPAWHEKARTYLWPRRSFTRSAQYFQKRVLRVNGTPYAIAMGVACGAFASFTPLIGFHILLALALTFILRGSLIAAMLGTAVGNPLTFPVIWALTFRVGRAILGEPVGHASEPRLDAPTSYTFEALAHFFERTWPVIKPMLVGSVPLGLTAALACYAVTYAAVLGYQRARGARREDEDAPRERATHPSNSAHL